MKTSKTAQELSWMTIKAIQAGDDGLLEPLMATSREVIYKYYRSKGLQDADAEDLTQEFLMDFFLIHANHLNGNPGKGTFLAYLITSAKFKYRDWWRNQYAERRGGPNKVSLDALKQQCGGVWEPNYESSVDAETCCIDWANVVWRHAWKDFLDQTDPDFIEVLKAFYRTVNPITTNEAARMLGVGFEAMNRRLFVARKRLTECLKTAIRNTLHRTEELDQEFVQWRRFMEGIAIF